MRHTVPRIYFKDGYWRVRRHDSKRGNVPVIVQCAYEFVNRLNHTDEAYAYRAEMWAGRGNGWYRKSDNEVNS